jgi:hypothetical protein
MCNDFILLFEFYQVGSDTRIGINSLHQIFDAANSNMESTPKHLKLTSNGLQNVIFCIIYAQSWHMWTPDDDFLGVDDTINGSSFCQIFDAANSDIECTPKHLK